MSQLLAAIDVGTNSVLLTLAKANDAGELTVTQQRACVTRLGQGVDQSGQLHPEAELRTLTCLREYRALMDEQGVSRAAAVGTSALRDAQGGASFLAQAQDILGFPLEVVSGPKEAELTFKGALSGAYVTGSACVFDIGGGSTELIVGNIDTGVIDASLSLNLGSVRLTERLALSDPPTRLQWEQLRSAIHEQLARFDLNSARDLPLVGVAGTVTTLAAMIMQVSPYDPALIHGTKLQSADLARLTERLFFMSVEQRLKLTGLTQGRADVIGAGAVLCCCIVEQAQARELIVSDRGVRFGLLQQLAMATPS